MEWAAIAQHWPELLGVLIAWLLPSPVTIAVRAAARAREAELKASATRGQVGDLDELD